MGALEKEKFDALIELANFRRARWASRNQLEWRISFSLWALLAASIYYIKDEQFPVWFAVLIWSGHGFILYKILMRNQEDNWLAMHYTLEAEKLVTDNPKTRLYGSPVLEGQKAWDAFWGDYSVMSQLFATAVLLSAPYILAAVQS
jgi:hypothetical protein